VKSILLLALPFCALFAAPAPTPPPTLTLKDGRVFHLKAPPVTDRGRVTFTTLDGKTYSLEQSQVESFVAKPPTPTRVPSTYNPQDSRALGAIARQERAKTGKTTDLSAPRPTAHPTKATHAARTGTAPPARTRTAAHAAATRTAPQRTPTPAPH